MKDNEKSTVDKIRITSYFFLALISIALAGFRVFRERCDSKSQPSDPFVHSDSSHFYTS